ncbi:hypothetical protein GIB67_011382 [Kingdonia uniflora]|uniref:Pentatricopeptide repeat-containing protein n=1 Tax=Kingdonia uniflora TaxID=39325 RepID=A0A7J7M3M0_9MAGN|nr:hypothetical protein GIB67_011382 [Kingdonia uniflora]
MPQRNQVSWNAMLTVLLKWDHLEGALRLFIKMPERNPRTYTSMITGLSRFGYVEEAWIVFESIPIQEHNVLSWTAMISSYIHNGRATKGLELFLSWYGSVIPNVYTFSIVLKGCLEVRSLVTGMQIHGLILKLLELGKEETVFVENSLIDLHTKLGSLGDAEKIFNGLRSKDLSSWNIMMDAYVRNLLMDKALEIFYSMVEKDTLSWNIVISGFAETGCGDKALEYFRWLLRSSEREIKPNPSTYTIVLTVCATFTKFEFGTQIHTQTLKAGLLQSNIFAGNSLISMYSRCGSIKDSEKIFIDMPKRDVVSSNSLIQGLGENGYSSEALEIGEMALSTGDYNDNTFIGLLTSCSHGGLVHEGMEYFNFMSSTYGTQPSLHHYNCVIDMLGRAGRIVEASTFLCKMPFTPNYVSWAALLNACMVHGNVEVGEVAARELQILEPRNVASYVMLGNIYRTKGLAGESKRVLDFMRNIGLKKNEGFSWMH